MFDPLAGIINGSPAAMSEPQSFPVNNEKNKNLLPPLMPLL
jgi:hypothetical protein